MTGSTVFFMCPDQSSSEGDGTYRKACLQYLILEGRQSKTGGGGLHFSSLEFFSALEAVCCVLPLTGACIYPEDFPLILDYKQAILGANTGANTILRL